MATWVRREPARLKWTPGCATRGTRSPSSIRRFCSKRQPGDNDAVTLVALETLRPAVQPNVTLLRLRTDTGLVGIGEAFFAAGAVEAYLHDHVAPVLLGWDDPTPEAAAARLAPYVGFQGGGVETRALGAVDLALWDLLGRRAGLPVVDLLGGAVRESIPIYNTCAGSGYVGSSSRQESGNWGLDRATAYEDLDAFLHRPAELARALHAEGIPGMKVWPFDIGAEKTGGTDILPDDLDRGLAVARAIREAVPSMQLMIELHGLWNLKAAERSAARSNRSSRSGSRIRSGPTPSTALARLKQATSVSASPWARPSSDAVASCRCCSSGRWT